VKRVGQAAARPVQGNGGRFLDRSGDLSGIVVANAFGLIYLKILYSFPY
jgi:hypothetical protein